MTVQTLAACQHCTVLLNLDQRVFCSIYRVVTWYAIQQVIAYCKAMKHLLKPCTGTFTQSMRLPCVYIVDKRKALEGLCPQDFDTHWF
jgi:hypothetical protein